ncbi:MAG: flagellar biosynthesis protein FliQ [Clostridiaceae bacterium]|jgi:flagellar biosynthetic protein FliQ|nr:flagellar biosynthesis protein FliQ [Clostridiaceae bacterium]
MDQGTVTNIVQQALLTVLYVSAPILGLSLIVGLIVSVFQAATQIQEQTLSFIPKILSVIAAILIFGPWMLNKLITFTRGLYLNMNDFIK